MKLPDQGTIEAFATIVDINRFSTMVSNDEEGIVSQFVRDVLGRCVEPIEKMDGEVIAFMGDALLALLPDAQTFYGAAVGIAKQINDHCEWISMNQEEDKNITCWGFAPGGASVKILAEFGLLKAETIGSRFLGNERIFIGDAINLAARIGSTGDGNRCHVGPKAAKLIGDAGYTYELDGPYKLKGKEHEREFEYHVLTLGEIWLEGPRTPGEETYLW